MSPPNTAEALTPAPARPAPTRPAPEPGVLPVSEDGREVSEETYWEEYYLESDIHYEWNRGRLEEKPVSDFGTILVYQWFLLLLQQFFQTQPIGKLVALEMGFRLVLPDGVVIRKPDFAVVRNDNPQPILPLDCSYHGVFDLCVEALSDRKRRDIERDTVEKKADYAAGGVPEYYILHREPERQAFFALSQAGIYTSIQPVDGVIHSLVLPGFRFRVADLCRRPPTMELRNDPVYADFVLPGWQAAERRAEAAEQRAEAESQRAEAEARRADAQTRQVAAEREARQRLEADLAALRARIGSPGSDGW